MFAQFSSSGAFSIRAIFKSDIIVSMRWWDPVITLMKIIKPELITVFIADGHFSILNLNKKSNKRRGKNIFESNYCDIYLLPDLISLQAVAKYPGKKYLYRPDYWDNPRIHFSSEYKEHYDIIFVYGNDPFFDYEYRKKLLALVNGIKEKFCNQYRICHVVPRGRNGKIILKELPYTENIFIGIGSENLVLSPNSIYLCTPSTAVWKLLSSSARIAIIDIYRETSCFHQSILRIRKPDDCAKVLSKDKQYWMELRKKVSDVLGDDPIPLAIDSSLKAFREGNVFNTSGWLCMARYNLRDYFSSIWSVMSVK